jgi:hypothetical protein
VVYLKIFWGLKAACNSLLPEESSFAPTCILVDNSDAEILAARCASSNLKCLIELNGNRAACCRCGPKLGKQAFLRRVISIPIF